MASNSIPKITKSRRLDIGIVIFIVIFIYVLICVISSLKQDNIVGYQVKKGMLSENRIYTGMCIREEIPVYSPSTGYVSLFVPEGQRVGYNDLVYSIDESGKFSDLIEKDPNVDNSLSETDLASLKQDIMLFAKNFKPNQFESANSFHSSTTDELSRLENRQMMSSIEEINSMHINDIIHFYRAVGSGIVTYFSDGYENVNPVTLTKKDFDVEAYEPTVILNDDLIEAGKFLYKYCNKENWSLCIFVPLDELKRLEEDEYVEVKFSKTQTSSWGRIHIVNTFDDGAIVQLSFTNSMVTFAKDRFIEVELMVEEDTGLKVPNSAISEESFYLIDKTFVTQGGNGSLLGVNKRVVSETGEMITKFVEVQIFDETETEYYVSLNNLNAGDLLVNVEDGAPEAQSTFTVGKRGTLVGVYNINKGYADFKQIEVLYSNDEYSIVKSNKALGIRAYDYIALDASVVNNNDFVY